MPTDLSSDQDFQNLSDRDQHAYLTDTDPDYGKLSADDQKAYRQYSTDITNPEKMLQKAQQQAAAVPGQLPRDPKESILGHQRAVRSGRDEVAQQTMPLLKTVGTIGTVAGLAAPGLGEATIPSMLATAARVGIGGGAGASIGEEGGSRIGSLFGPTGREVGGTIGAIGGGLVGGGIAGGLERDPATGKVNPLPLGIQRFIPKRLVPMGESTPVYGPTRINPEHLAEVTPSPEIGSPENPGWHSKIPSRMPTISAEPDPLIQAVREGRAAKIPTRMPAISDPSGRGGPIPIEAVRGGQAVRTVPEPRTPFEGENPKYMASVPRKNLRSLAAGGKPGAGTQLQQLGEKVIYAPPAGFPAPREVIHNIGEEPEPTTIPEIQRTRRLQHAAD